MDEQKSDLPTATRSPEFVDRIDTDKNGVPYEGERQLLVPTEERLDGFWTTVLMYHKGKLHGEPAIRYPDGLEEVWENGKFVRVFKLPYSDRPY